MERGEKKNGRERKTERSLGQFVIVNRRWLTSKKILFKKYIYVHTHMEGYSAMYSFYKMRVLFRHVNGD